ncbi:MAG: S41 family peptidase [Defluviitaleaceae bacterium]|nr:S41 family peptidase [Defluviitaleaceae bacterium]
MLNFAGEFLKKGTYMISLKNIKTSTITEIENIIDPKIRFKHMSIVCDYTTHSSAELFIEILKSYNNVTIFGEPSGKNYIYSKQSIGISKMIEQKIFYAYNKNKSRRTSY